MEKKSLKKLQEELEYWYDLRDKAYDNFKLANNMVKKLLAEQLMIGEEYETSIRTYKRD